MKEQDIASKAISLKKKKTVTKKVKDTDCESLASTVIMTDSEDEEIHILFQNLPLIEELNLIRNIKVQKKLSAGVKLARQILDI
jgi:ABC-type lipoprotein export system ATPase subunit